MSETVSNTLKGFSVIVLLITISKTSHKSPINKTPKIILGTRFKEASLVSKNQIKAKPSHKPPRKCISISKYHIEEYQYKFIARKFSEKIRKISEAKNIKSFLESIFNIIRLSRKNPRKSGEFFLGLFPIYYHS
jgi:hypothetical protein